MGQHKQLGFFFMVALGVPSAITAQGFGAGGVTRGEELINDLCNSVIKSNPSKNDR